MKEQLLKGKQNYGQKNVMFLHTNQQIISVPGAYSKKAIEVNTIKLAAHFFVAVLT